VREVKETISQQEGSCKIDIQQGQAKRVISSISKWESRDSIEVSDTFKSEVIEIIPQDNLLPRQEMILSQDPISKMHASYFMVDLISYNSDAIVINPQDNIMDLHTMGTSQKGNILTKDPLEINRLPEIQ
jgi:hypothetical protein